MGYMQSDMLVSTLLPNRFRGDPGPRNPSSPSWLNRRFTPGLQRLSRFACLHPIQTIVVVALAASTSYVSLLRDSLFSPPTVGRADWSSLVEGSRRLAAGPDSSWRWQSPESGASFEPADSLALLTLVFPDTAAAAVPPALMFPANLSVTALPTTSNSLTAYSHDTTLAYAVSLHDVPEFLAAAQEITSPGLQEDRETDHDDFENRMWIMRAARVNSRTSLPHWVANAWSKFLDLLKNAQALDIFIMILGYLAMHLTFVSLFLSMRRMGSNFWLATSVLLSSSFAFLFGLIVTTQLGVPVSFVLLSEGLPFLVVTIGFEKSIILTRAVLSHAVESRKPRNQQGTVKGSFANADGAKDENAANEKNTAQYGRASSKNSNHCANGRSDASTDSSAAHHAIRAAIKDKGYEIVRDYVIEIIVLVLGAASGVQGGLQQFCFLAAWILVFDCILLFCVYTAILSIKIEINRIKRHVDMRRALEDDGLSRRIAEKVARANDWPRDGATDAASGPWSLFGTQVKSGSVPRFKVLMVSGFVLVNAVNLCTIPFRGPDSFSYVSSLAHGLGGVVASPAVDPYKVAVNGLEAILLSSREAQRPVVVTVLNPIKYELAYPSVHYDLPSHKIRGGLARHSARASPDRPLESDNAHDEYGSFGVGGAVVGSLLESLEDPILSKWILVALAMSVALNGYLFNAARWSIKDPNLPDHQIDRYELEEAQKFNDGCSTPGIPLGYILSSSPVSNSSSSLQRADLQLTSAPAMDYSGGLLARKPIRESGVSNEGSTPTLRTVDVLDKMLRENRAHDMTDEELVTMSMRGIIPGYALERTLQDFTRAVKIRRTIISRTRATIDFTAFLDQSKLPFEDYNWERVFGACCENVIGYMPIPVGVAGPLVIDGQSYFIPMATTEGVLVASTSRGCKAINSGGGAITVLTGDGITRGPCVSFETLERAGAAKLWLDSEAGEATMRRAFNSTSRFARLQTMKTALAGTNLYIRFKTSTGDAMGMNMISKGVEHALHVMMTEEGFDDMCIVAVSGNYCVDKKPAAINWIDGRGKSVVAEAIIPGDVVKNVLKCDVDQLVELNISKNLIGSAMAASVGGFNAHAANVVAAMFLATGQDPAQVVESANCITIMRNLRGSLQISVSMPSIEVGTLGGGTILEPQSAMLDMLGVRGPHPTTPGENARRLARIVAAAVLAGELSLCSALAAGHLVRAHMQHNRTAPPTRVGTPAMSTVPATAVDALTPVGLGVGNGVAKDCPKE